MANLFKKLIQMTDLAMDTAMSNMRKAMQSPVGAAAHQRQGIESDPDRSKAQYGWKEKLVLVPDESKRLMSLKDPVIAAIQLTRVNQISAFSRPQKDQYTSGYVIQRKEITGDNKEDIDKKKDDETIKFLYQYIAHCGVMDKEREESDEVMDFDTFLKLIVKDRLIFDAIAIERIPDKRGRMHHFLPLSGPTIRFSAKNLNPNLLYLDTETPKDTPQEIQRKALEGEYKYVQILKGRILRAFTKEDLIYRMANQTNDMFTNGYPITELDLLASTVSAHIYAEKYNRSIFTHGFNTRGMLNLKGEVDEEQLSALRRAWYAQGVGYDALFRTPIINAPEGIEWVPMATSNRDMEFTQYMDYLIKLACAMYLIAPEEINFSSNRGVDAVGSGMNYNNIERRLIMSKDRGLMPLLRYLENIINEDIIPYINPEFKDQFEFKFVGMESETKVDVVGRLEKEIKIYKTVNEVRAEQGLEALDGCDVILDNVFMQWYNQYSEEGKANQARMAQASQQAAGMGGAPGEGGDEEVRGDLDNSESLQNLNSAVEKKSGLEKAFTEDSNLIRVEVYKKSE